MPALFALGRVVATPGALRALARSENDPARLLARHVTGDWGDLDDEDRSANEGAVLVGSRILSAYHLTDGTKIWIITETDRRSTCVLLPEEY